MKIIVVIYGGRSEERDVSIISGRQIAKALKENGYDIFLIDPIEFASYSDMICEIRKRNPFVVFNALHGSEGEDGRIQAIFELEKIKYTGSGYLASAIAMNKDLSNKIAKMINLKVPETEKVSSKNQILYMNKFPLVVKPNTSGSSVGIHIAKNEEQLKSAVEDSLKYSDFALIQEYIEGKEITVTVLDGESLVPVEISPRDGWYDYVSKYTKGKTNYIIPARLSEDETSVVRKIALKLFNEINCKSYARIDFRFNGKDFYFLEINTLPGMTPLSLTPMAAKYCGYDFTELLEKIIETSI